MSRSLSSRTFVSALLFSAAVGGTPALADDGAIERAVVGKAMRHYCIDADKIDPIHA